MVAQVRHIRDADDSCDLPKDLLMNRRLGSAVSAVLLLATGLVVFVGVADVAIAAPATNKIDQKQESSPGGTCQASTIDGSYTAQSFTAGASGTLDQVDLLLVGGKSAAPTAAIQITKVLGNGLVDQANVLGQATAASSMTPTPAWQPFYLTTPVSVVAGTTYAITFTGRRIQWCGDPSDVYAGGFAQRLDSTWGLNNAVIQDFTFRTYLALAAQTITFASLPSMVVGGGNGTLTASASSGLPITFTSLTTSVCSVVGNATVHAESAGLCTIAADQPGDGNTFGPALQKTQSVVIDKGSQTITFANPGPRLLGTPLTVTASATSGATVAFDTTGNAVACDVTPGGVVTFTGLGTCEISAHQGGTQNYEEAATVSQSFQVLKGQATVTASSGTQVYGSIVTPTITATVTGANAGDLGTITCTADVTATTPVGVQTDAATCSSANNPNYAMTYVPANVTVTRAPVVVTAGPSTSTFGSTPSAPTPSFAGFKNSQTSAALTTQPTCTAGVTAATNVGTYPKTTSCSGAVAANYSFTYAKGTATVTRAPVTVTASSGTQVYGSAVKPTITPTVTGATPAALGTITCTANVAATTPVGVQTDAATCSSANKPNYAVTYVPANVTVTPAPVVVTAGPSTSVFGSTPSAPQPSFDGLKNGQDDSVLTTPPTCTAGVTAATDVGTYPNTTSCSGAVADNYSFTYLKGTATVTQAPVTVTASSGTQVYGSVVTPTITPTVTGANAGDLGTITCTADVAATTPVGVQTDAATCSSANNPNYAVIYVRANVTVTPAPVVVTAGPSTSTFGSTPSAPQASFDGLKNGQDDSVLTTPPTCTAGVTAATDVGTYPNTTSCSGAVADNYSFTYLKGTATVTQAPVTVTASSATVVYGSSQQPVITPTVVGATPAALGTITCGGTVNAATPVGSYETTCSAPNNANYDVTFVPGYITVEKRNATITADSKTISYGQPDPVFTYTVSGLKPGDTLTTLPTCSVDGAHTNAGTYTITCAGATNSNYDLTYAWDTLTVTKAPLTITAKAPSPSYPFGAAIPTTFTPTYTGYGAGQGPTTAPTCTSTAHTGSTAGTYPITCAGGNPTVAGDTAYTFTFTYLTGTLTVGKPRCSDGIDNDGNGLTDYPRDLGCTSATDNTETSPAACTVSTRLNGTTAANKLLGTARNDTITGGAGNDTLFGYGGNDCLRGGTRNDRIHGGYGNDRIHGGYGKDRIHGGYGNDRIHGGYGNDRIYGGYGNDRIYGGYGNDRIYGGYGNDRIYAADGTKDTVICGPGTDVAIVDPKDAVKNCETKIVRTTW
jgi:hypothetical protein